jgi:phosphoenolpyruvate synthase/pyruvate phosphate dikinase
MKKDMLDKLSVYFNVPKIVTEFDSEKLYAVRSNDSSEDTSNESKAGFFDTKLFVPGNKVNEAINEILKKADNYFVQEMIDSDFSFVYIYKDSNKEILTVNNGLNEGITSGQITGTSYWNGNIIGSQEYSMIFDNELKIIEDKKPLFKIEEILSFCRKVRSYCNFKSINLEGCFANNKFYLLQCRHLNS